MKVTLTESEVRDAVELYLTQTFGPIEIKEFSYQKRMKGGDPVIVEADIARVKRVVAVPVSTDTISDDDIPF